MQKHFTKSASIAIHGVRDFPKLKPGSQMEIKLDDQSEGRGEETVADKANQ